MKSITEPEGSVMLVGSEVADSVAVTTAIRVGVSVGGREVAVRVEAICVGVTVYVDIDWGRGAG